MRPVLPVLLLMALALAGCSGGSSDDDGDGVSDELELDGWATHTVVFMDRSEAVRMTSDPSKVDTDGDGLTDHEELLARTNPRAADTDEDGLSDCQELVHTVLADCENPDFDLDANGDGGYPTDPRNADSDPGPTRHKPTLPFRDLAGARPPGGFGFGDGISDGEEVNGYDVQVGARTLRVTSDPRQADTDGDGLEDAEERLYGGDPGVFDSDGDGCRDGQDPWPGSDPAHRFQGVSFRLDRAEAATLRFQLFMLGQLVSLGERDVAAGETLALDDMMADVQAPCSMPAHEAWGRVRVLVQDVDGGDFLDVASNQPDATIEWNVRTDAMRWNLTAGADMMPSAVTVSGLDGQMVYSLLVQRD